MRCSLLALSSFIDTELDLEPTAELEAHLVACERCRTALGHLSEESARIGGLARLHVPDDAVHDLFSQIGLIAEEDDLPEGPVRRDHPAPVEAPPWFGAERGAALPWAPRPTGHDRSPARELIGERIPGTAIAEPPELVLWDETIDQIATAAPEPPPVHLAREPQLEPEPQEHVHVQGEPIDVGPQPLGHAQAEHFTMEPQPPHATPEPQPPDLSTSAPMAAPPQMAAGPNPFQRLRDAVAVRFALRRGAGSDDSGVEIVSGVGAPKWNQRTRTRHWSDSPPIVAAVAPPVVEPPVPQVKPSRAGRFLGRLTGDAALKESIAADEPFEPTTPDMTATQDAVEATAPSALADVLNEVASLAAPLERTPTRGAEAAPAEPVAPAEAAPVLSAFDDVEYGAGAVAAFNDSASVAPTLAPDIDTGAPEDDGMQARVDTEPMSPPFPGRHVRRLHSHKSDRRDWNPAQPVTGRHVLPLGGPAVGAADRDRRLWLFGAVTVVLMLLGLLVGRQVTQTGPLAAATIPRSHPTSRATTPATAAPIPIATAAPAPTAIIPAAPTPPELTSAKTLGTGSGGFSVADVRYGEHPNDFRLVFDMAFPNTVTGSPTTVIGYDGATTLYVEFNGVTGASDVASMPSGQVVVSVVALPMVRNSEHLIFKITLSKHAPFDAYYLSGARLVIDVT
jgi:hypothetical protein